MEKLTIVAKPGQTKFTVPTDKKVTIVLCSEIVTAAWSRGRAYAGQETLFQITTAFVGQGAKIVVEGESEKGVKFGKITSEIFYNDFRDAFTLPPDLERGDKIHFTVELPDNEVWAQSDSIPVYPLIGVYNLKWSKDEALDGDELTLSCDVSQVDEGTDALITIYLYSAHGAHERVTAITPKVKNKKIEILWEFRYRCDAEQRRSYDEKKEDDKGAEPPKYFFTIDIGSTKYGQNQESKFLTYQVKDLVKVDGWWIPILQVEPSPSECPEHDGQSLGVIEMEDALFNLNSAAFLPERVLDESDAEEDQVSVNGLEVLKDILLSAAAEEENDAKILIAGHTDASGSGSYNFSLSRLRAQSVFYLLKGDKESHSAWVAQYRNKQNQGVNAFIDEDVQQILKWAASADGLNWGSACDSGKVDGLMDDKTREAIRGFQRRYNKEFNASIFVNGTIGEQFWGAVFDVYQLKLRQLMGNISAQEMDSSYRSKLQWLENKGVVGCGETWASDSSAHSQSSRRVDILFFNAEDEAPALKCLDGGCEGKKCPIYRLEDGEPVIERLYLSERKTSGRSPADLVDPFN